MRQMAQEFFQSLYSKDSNTLPASNWPIEFPRLSHEQTRLIHQGLTDIEIKDAAFDIGALKALGPDGLQAHFIQTQWEKVGRIICDLIHDLWRNPEKLKLVNQTTITLIPKVETPTRLVEFRPISLCNVSYKIVSKIIANRLKGVMNDLIRLNQCSFIKGRQSCDNIFIVQEAIHSMRQKKKGNEFVAVIVDMEKTYDKLDWDFIRFTLQGIGLGDQLVNLIMSCIQTASMRVAWNGQLSDVFYPLRGARQGDPLSPYIFVLCMERLGQLIQYEVQEGHWEPLTLHRGGPKISHHFFADDLILFCKASMAQMEEMREIMHFVCGVSGHKVSLMKSRMFASRNVHASRANQCRQALGIALSADLGKYLGVPLIHKRVTKATFAPVVDKVRKRLANWKGKFLSTIGKTVLIKSVLSSIPYYQMQTSLMPSGALHELEKISRNFLWSQTAESKKLHLIGWETCKQDKDLGGLGIKDLCSQNEAFMMKLCWGILTKPEALWVKCLKCKYDCGEGTHPKVERKRNQSAVWKGTVAVWDRFMSGVGRKIVDGRSSRAWTDLWLPLPLPLIQYVNRNMDSIKSEEDVASFVTSDGEWDARRWRCFLPEEVVMKILSSEPPRGHGDDKYWWRESSDGDFSIKLAYSRIFNQTGENQHAGLWRKLWHWDVPERVKFFMWQVVHERVPTNLVRARVIPQTPTTCSFECHGEESILHTLRDCEAAKRVWRELINPSYMYSFFTGTLQDWLKWNARKDLGNRKWRKWPWHRCFGILCWLIWKNRCAKVFDGRAEVHFCQDWGHVMSRLACGSSLLS